MTVPTTAQLQAYLTQLYAARDALLVNKTYTLGSISISRVNEKWLSDEIAKTENRLNTRARTGSSSASVIIPPRSSQ